MSTVSVMPPEVAGEIKQMRFDQPVSAYWARGASQCQVIAGRCRFAEGECP